MSGTLCQITVAATVRAWSQLPDGMDDDDVMAEVSDVVEKALAGWYADRGQLLLRCEPAVC